MQSGIQETTPKILLPVQSKSKPSKIGLKVEFTVLAKAGNSFLIKGHENYSESRFLKDSLKGDKKELTISYFRVKRHLALKNWTSRKWGELQNFKFPVFSWWFFFITTVLTYFFGFGVTSALSLLSIVMYHHPHVKFQVDHVMQKVMFDRKMLHRWGLKNRIGVI